MPTNVQLNWVEPVVDNLGNPFDPSIISTYEIKRNGAVIHGGLAAPATSYLDPTAPTGSTLTYEVVAEAPNGNSAPASVQVTTTTGIPGPVTGLTAVEQ